MRYLKSIFLILFAPLIMGSSTGEMKFTRGIHIGDLVPEINLEGVSLKTDSYVLLQFWAAYNGESRMKNVQMNNKISKMDSELIRMVSISFDEKKSVFEGAVQADKQNISNQFNDNAGVDSEVYKTFHLKKGFGNLLINSKGMIVAKDLAPGDVEKFVS